LYFLCTRHVFNTTFTVHARMAGQAARHLESRQKLAIANGVSRLLDLEMATCFRVSLLVAFYTIIYYVVAGEIIINCFCIFV
jgi:hypothetical protein